MCLDTFFGLHIKSLINLNIFRTAFGIGGEIAPIAPPWLRACIWLLKSFFKCGSRVVHDFFY